MYPSKAIYYEMLLPTFTIFYSGLELTSICSFFHIRKSVWFGCACLVYGLPDKRTSSILFRITHIHVYNFQQSRGRFKRWPVSREIIGGPVSCTYDWFVRQADIFTLDLKKKCFWRIVVWKFVPCCIFVFHLSQLNNLLWYCSVLLPSVTWIDNSI